MISYWLLITNQSVARYDIILHTTREGVSFSTNKFNKELNVMGFTNQTIISLPLLSLSALALVLLLIKKGVCDSSSN